MAAAHLFSRPSTVLSLTWIMDHSPETYAGCEFSLFAPQVHLPGNNEGHRGMVNKDIGGFAIKQIIPAGSDSTCNTQKFSITKLHQCPPSNFKAYFHRRFCLFCVQGVDLHQANNSHPPEGSSPEYHDHRHGPHSAPRPPRL